MGSLEKVDINANENIKINLENIDQKSDENRVDSDVCDATQTTTKFIEDTEEFEERIKTDLVKEYNEHSCCGQCCDCLGRFSSAVIISSNFCITVAILITLLFIYASIRSIANHSKHRTDAELYQENCFAELGCFPKLYGCLIPTVTIPQSPEELGVKFHVFTNSSYEVIDMSDDVQIAMSEFNPLFDTKLIIHGYKSGFAEDYWNGGKYNVIAVDWAKGANNNRYWVAAASTNVVGAIVAKFIQKLIYIKKADITRFHLIGHSLGAHIAGVVGYHFPFPKIALITGLDPAGPCFFKYLTVLRDPKEYLDSEDATIVQTIHTNGADLGFVSTKAISHYEFYPNGGLRQPGCYSVLDLKTSLYDNTAFTPRLSCSHNFVQQLVSNDYRQAFNDCQPIAYKCDNWDSYSSGDCSYDCTGNKCQIMAFGLQYYQKDFQLTAPEKPMKLYIKTSDSEPYCLYRYVIYVKVSYGDGEEGVLNITIKASNERNIVFENRFYSGEVYRKELAFSPTKAEPLGVIRELEVDYSSLNKDNSNKIIIKEILIKFLSTKHINSDYLCNSSENIEISDEKQIISCKIKY